MLQQAYSDSPTKMPMFYHWYNVFWDGWGSVADEPQEGWPSTACNGVLQNTVAVLIQDRRITVHELAQCLYILVGRVFSIFQDEL